MNRKAAITKELNAKHIKILEAILKLPENRECADCKTKSPRWASVNIGVFICLYCSGIHRSLGVHISKVRSVTLDTWLPEHIALLQSMGNEKSNAYWEAGLPPNYNRGGIESFIRTKYIEKRWAPRDSNAIISLGEYANNQHLYKEKNGFARNEKERAELSGGGSPRIDKRHEDHRKQDQDQEIKNKHQLFVGATSSDLIKSVNRESPIEPAKVAGDDSLRKPVVLKVQSSAPNHTTIPKVDYATELFRILCIDDSSENDSSSFDTNAWVDFESDADVKVRPKSLASKIHPEPKLEDVHNASAPLTNANSVLNSEVISDRRATKPPPTIYDHHVSGWFQQPSLNEGNVNRMRETQVPMQNGGLEKFGVSAATRNAGPSFYRADVGIHSKSTTAKKPILPVSGYDYDFSFLTQGMFSKP